MAIPVSPAMWVQGNVGIYDSDVGGSAVTTDAATIGRWEDQSGNGRHLVQATSGSRPRYDALAGHVVDPMPDLRNFSSPASFTLDQRDFTVLVLNRLTSLRRAQNGGSVHTNHVLMRGVSDSLNLYYSGNGASTDMGKLSGYDGANIRTTTSIPYTTDLTALAFVGRSGSFDTWVRDSVATTTAFASGTSDLLTFLYGGGSGGNGAWQSSIADLIVYQRALTSTEITDEWLPYAISRGMPASQSNQIACVGDSLTHGYASTLNRNWPSKLTAFPNVYKRVTAESGTTLATISGQSAREDSLLRSGETNILCVWLGTNDIAAGTTGATLASNLASYCSARRAAGWKVIVFTMLDRAPFNATQDGYRATFNATVRSDWATYADGLVDVDADSRLDDSTDLTYFDADTVHLKDAGLAVVAELAQPKIQLLLPGKPLYYYTQQSLLTGRTLSV